MSEPKNFLARWSERKLQPEAEKPPEEKKPSPSDQTAAKGSSDSVPEFDISTLPSLDSIAPNSDIRAFLQRGVPAELTRAALRRAWSTDPAIRDFVGLSENSWDFNAPNSIPGFGSLTAADVQRNTEHLLRAIREQTNIQSPEDHAPENEKISPEKPPPTAELDSKPDTTTTTAGHEQRALNAATQQDEGEESADEPVLRRRHGGALPE